jgi:acylphosphatase
MSELHIVRLHAIIEGYVQGVGFRAFAQDLAARAGLTGWVRNRWDSSVEVVAEGEQQILERFLTTLYRGPRSAQVTGVTPEWLDATGEFKGFTVRSTSGS